MWEYATHLPIQRDRHGYHNRRQPPPHRREANIMLASPAFPSNPSKRARSGPGDAPGGGYMIQRRQNSSAHFCGGGTGAILITAVIRISSTRLVSCAPRARRGKDTKGCCVHVSHSLSRAPRCPSDDGVCHCYCARWQGEQCELREE